MQGAGDELQGGRQVAKHTFIKLIYQEFSYMGSVKGRDGRLQGSYHMTQGAL